MKKFYLVDGSGYIFRAFFALTPLTNSKGLPTNALFGFLRMFGKLLREEDPHYIAVAFDRPEPTFRHELYTEYKANRDECPAELVPQLPYFRQIVEALGLRSLEKAGVEADDIIATLVEKIRAEGDYEVVVVSGDKDLLQLVGPGVRVFDAMRDVRFDEAGVKEKLGVPPNLVADYLAIIGDSSDNVPGVKGVGPKTAVALLEHFGSLDRLLENMSEIASIGGLRGAKGVAEKIESSAEVLRLSRVLVGLDSHVEPFASSLPSEYEWNGISQDALRALCEQLEFRNVYDSFRDFKTSLTGPVAAAVADPYAEKDYTIVTLEQLPGFVEALSKTTRFAFDTETTSLDVLSAELVGMSFSWEANRAFYVPVCGPELEIPGALPRETVLNALKPIFRNESIAKIGFNLKYDLNVLARYGVNARGKLIDGLIAIHLLHPDRRTGTLKSLAKQYLNEEMVTFEDLLGEESDICKVPIERVGRYAAHDADASRALCERLMEELASHSNGDAAEAPSLMRAFEVVEMPVLPVLAAMERRGVGLDVKALAVLEAQLSATLKELETNIYGLAGRDFNLNSPKQLAAVLFEELKLPTKGVRKNQSGYSTDAGVLELLAAEYPIAGHLLSYREIHKLISTYVVALPKLVNPVTGRIHTSFNQAIAATGRLSSTDPNLQNIPIRNERGRAIRKAFASEPGFVMVAADYSQVELRVLAHLSEDENLRRAFLSGEDIHERTADEIFGRDLALTPEEKKDRRRIAKTINFGVVYGMGAFRLAGDLGVSRKEAQRFIDEYFARYPKVLKYYEAAEQRIDRLGYCETLFGRRRYLAEVDSSGRDAGYARRSLQNAPIQGTAAEIIKLAMVGLATRLAGREERIRMVLQVHDELVFEVSEQELEEAKEIVRTEMENAVKLSVPLVVDVRSGRNWGDAL